MEMMISVTAEWVVLVPWIDQTPDAPKKRWSSIVSYIG